MAVALILAAAIATPTAPKPGFNPPLYACGAQVDPKFVTYVPPAEPKGGDPLLGPVNAGRDSRLTSVPADMLDCLKRLQRTRSPQTR